MRKGWDDALELQNALHHALKSDEYNNYLRWFGHGQSKAVGYGANGGTGVLDPDAFRRMIQAAVATASTDEADPMWVNNDVIDLVEYAAETFQPEAVHETDLIVPRAFCVFERALYAKDIEGRQISFRAASWGPFLDRLLVALWRHTDDDDDYSRNQPTTFKRRIAGSPLLLLHNTMGKWGDAAGMKEPANFELFKRLQVLWRLAKQQVVVGSTQSVSRPTWRSKHNWREIKTVKVFTLRRALHKSHGEDEGGKLSYRFPVEGHWRNQWYPSIKDHRQIWIHGYVKGPEGAPFVAKRRAVEFVR